MISAAHATMEASVTRSDNRGPTLSAPRVFRIHISVKFDRKFTEKAPVLYTFFDNSMILMTSWINFLTLSLLHCGLCRWLFGDHHRLRTHWWPLYTLTEEKTNFGCSTSEVWQIIAREKRHSTVHLATGGSFYFRRFNTSSWTIILEQHSSRLFVGWWASGDLMSQKSLPNFGMFVKREV